MRIFVFGSSITSTYWNGAATYYRGIYKNLYRLGYQVTFAEPDIYQRQLKRDSSDISYATVVLYHGRRDLVQLLETASEYDFIIKHSGIGADDEFLEAAVLRCQSSSTGAIFWDVDAPATLARLEVDARDPFLPLISQYDAILTYGGGKAVIKKYRSLGARECHAIYNALDPDTHYPVPPAADFACDLLFIGHRLPDREKRVEDYFLQAAAEASELSFLLGGEGWKGKKLPGNVRWIGHVSSDLHNQVNCSARFVLNINRDSMAQVGYSPPTRIFEAAGAGCCVITDLWSGVEDFFIPGLEILTARSADDIVGHLRCLDSTSTQQMGKAMRRRALRDHSYEARAKHVHRLLQELLRTGHSKNSPLPSTTGELTREGAS